ncbi:MAG: hypothetical protein K2Y27_35175 [Xanthobacteraceae bacterium]|nr:hypothetical protein [Xanthobacteraceae bacterium]
MRYLITDAWAGDSVFVQAPNVTAALISRENELRRSATSYRRAGKPLLPPTARASHCTLSDVIDVSFADVYCRGRRENVVQI